MYKLKGKSDKYIAALAVREKSIEILRYGLDSLFSSTAIQDYRDIISGLVLYYDAATRLDLDADYFFKEYGSKNQSIEKYIIEFITRSTDLKKIDVGGYKVVYNPEFNYDYNF